MRRQRAAGLAGGTENRQRSCDEAESGEKVAQLLGRSRSGQDQKTARRMVKVGQKSRGSLLSYDERRSQPKPFGAARRARVTQVQGVIPSCWGGGWSRGYRPIGVSPRH